MGLGINYVIKANHQQRTCIFSPIIIFFSHIYA